MRAFRRGRKHLKTKANKEKKTWLAKRNCPPGAQQRLAALSSIDPTLDLSNGLTLAAYRAEVVSAQAKQDAYNTLLSQVDQSYNEFQAAEKSIRDLSERILAGVASKYGKDSSEYEMAGGTRKSERKRPTRKTPPTTA